MNLLDTLSIKVKTVASIHTVTIEFQLTEINHTLAHTIFVIIEINDQVFLK